MNRKGTERIDEGFAVGVLGGEHGDEEKAIGVAAHALKKVQVPSACLFATGPCWQQYLRVRIDEHRRCLLILLLRGSW